MMFWEYNNINKNIEIIYNNIKKVFKKGYWTFDLIKNQFEFLGNVTLLQNEYDCSCTLNLKNRGPVLGFSTNRILSQNTPTQTDELDINQGLQHKNPLQSDR